MPVNSPFPKFVHYFNASAVAVSVRWRRPFESCEQLGAVLVPAVGGKYSTKCLIPQSLAKGAVSVEAYETSVSSDYADLPAARGFTLSQGLEPNRWPENNLAVQTAIVCKVKGMQVVNADPTTRQSRVVRLERVEIKAMSSRKPGAEVNHSELSLKFSGVKIDGKALTIDVDTAAFNGNSTHSKLAGAKLKNGACPRNDDKRVVGTVVKSIEWAREKVADVGINGHTVFVPGFGTIYFGEVISSHEHRRVITARFSLGSPSGGGVDGPEIGSDGHGIP